MVPKESGPLLERLPLKIDNAKVVDLRKKAKRLRIKGFSRLRKQE